MSILKGLYEKPKKTVKWHGDSLDVLRKLPIEVRQAFGIELAALENHLPAKGWKPFPGLGRQAFELRTKTKTGAYRAIYVTFIKDEIHVLHVFKKTTQKTAPKDVAIARQRLKQLTEG